MRMTMGRKSKVTTAKTKIGAVIDSLRMDVSSRLPNHLTVREGGTTSFTIDLADVAFPGQSRSLATVSLDGSELKLNRRGRSEVYRFDLNDPKSLEDFEEYLNLGCGISLRKN